MRHRVLLTLGLALVASAWAQAQMQTQTVPVEGLRQNDPGVHALTGARIVVAPGQVVENATLVMRNGLIEAVGANVTPPPDARVWDMSGRTLYAGFIDAYSGVGMPTEGPSDDEPVRGAQHWNPQMRAWTSATALMGADEARVERMHASGFTAAMAVPQLGMFRGQAAAVSLDGRGANSAVLRGDVAQVVTLDRDNRVGGSYPSSGMGGVAFIRQVLLDADWYIRAREAYEAAPAGLERPEFNVGLAALERAVRGNQPVLFEAADEEEILRALRIAGEFNIQPWIVASGGEYRLVDRVSSFNGPLILPVAFPDAPDVSDPVEALDVELETLRHWYLAPENPSRLAAAGVEFALTSHDLGSGDDFLANVRQAIRRGLSAQTALAALTTTPARMLGIDRTHGTLEAGKAANVVVASGDLFAEEATVVDVWVDGLRFAVPSRPVRSRGNGAEAVAGMQLADIRPALAYGRASQPDQPAAVLVRNATVWTQGPEGIIQNGDLLIEAGRVSRVGRNLQAPAGAVVIDGTGKHVTPGIIDAHLHAGASGGINEGGGAIVPEVQLGDMITMDNPWTYLALAGGTTTAHVMHGSANPIGGQNQIVKMRWGALPEEIKFEGAPRTVKFALGENPKRRENRYPDTRMGTHQIIRDHFQAALEYARDRDTWESGGRQGIPPRRDLRMDALVDILTGNILVQSHSYRQDEILMLMRLAEEYGFRVKAFQHAVEAYKVAPELAEHGAGAVVWSDWSSFKIEAYDATTYNARLLLEAGVVTSLHSDNSQLSSRMHWEAAKMLRTGLDEEAALSLVTTGPARALGIDSRVGSLEAGKDGDFVVWTASPLSTHTRAEQTWIDGRKYFDMQDDLRAREEIQRERARLIQLILADEAPDAAGRVRR